MSRRSEAGRPRKQPVTGCGTGADLTADYFNKNPLFSAAVEFTIEYLFPGPEIEASFRYCNNDLPPHDLSLQVSVPVIFTGTIVKIMGKGFMGGQFLEPTPVILVQTGLIIVYEHRCGDVHCVY